MKIAILGGTGSEGTGLALRWAASGHEIFIGSRLQEKGENAAAELTERLASRPAPPVQGGDNLWAALQADVVVLSVPYAAQEKTLSGAQAGIAGKLLVTVVAPLGSPKARVWRLPSGLSAAEEAQAQLGDEVRVVAAFQNIAAGHLQDLDHELDTDVLVCGDKKADKEIVMRLCGEAGMRGVNAGALQNAVVAEGLTAVLLGINIRHKTRGAGIRITGI